MLQKSKAMTPDAKNQSKGSFVPANDARQTCLNTITCLGSVSSFRMILIE